MRWIHGIVLTAFFLPVVTTTAATQEELQYRGFWPSMPVFEFLRAAQRVGVNILCEARAEPPRGFEESIVVCATPPPKQSPILQVLAAFDTASGRVVMVHIEELAQREFEAVRWFEERFASWGEPDLVTDASLIWFDKQRYAQVDTAHGRRSVILGSRSAAIDLMREKVVGDVLLEADLDDPPELVSCPRPQYPSVAERQGISDHLVFQFVVGVDGKPEPWTFELKAGKYVEFLDPALKAIQGCQFRPGKVDGTPVRVMVTQSVSFTAKR
jgi:hypothetical protein